MTDIEKTAGVPIEDEELDNVGGAIFRKRDGMVIGFEYTFATADRKETRL